MKGGKEEKNEGDDDVEGIGGGGGRDRLTFWEFWFSREKHLYHRRVLCASFLAQTL